MITGERPLRVALDLSATRLGRAGVARTALALADALDAQPGVEVLRLGTGPAPAPGSAARRTLALRQDLLWHPRGARREARTRGADVLHAPLPRGPLGAGAPPTVITVHDLAVIRHPETLSGWNRAYTRRTLSRIAAAADAVVAVSEDTAADLAAFAPSVQDRIHVIPNGVAAFWAADDDLPSPVEGPYVLAVGTPEPRKNLARLAEAMRRRRADGAPERLVLAGADGWGADDVPAEDWIVRLGRVDDRALRALYRGAACVAVPSLHEGSGLPVLEAFAAGAPVACARTGALPETAGDAAALVEPLDPRSIAAGVDEAIARADELVARGRTRAAAAGWERAAARHVELYRSLA